MASRQIVFLLVALCLNLTPTLASECSTRLRGTCLNSLAYCPAGSHVSFSYCGFLQICCFRPTSDASHGTSSGSGSTSGHGSTSGSSGSGSSGSGSSGSGSSGPAVSSHSNTGQCGVALTNTGSRIVGGQTAAEHEFPWQVSLMYDGNHMCGGTLIDREWVITAAHCFDQTYKDLWKVALGVHDTHLIYRSNYLSVKHIFVHSQFNDNDKNHDDIAMIQLDHKVDITSSEIRTACLPQPQEDFDNEMCVVTGWGSRIENGAAQRFLQKVSIPVMSNDLCNYYLGHNMVDSTNVCAGYRQGGKDACQGDSGGPLVCQMGGVWKLAGIVSYGFGCGEKYAPGVYTRVSAYLDWINNVKARGT